jgi:hypothetical protein
VGKKWAKWAKSVQKHPFLPKNSPKMPKIFVKQALLLDKNRHLLDKFGTLLDKNGTFVRQIFANFCQFFIIFSVLPVFCPFSAHFYF